MKYGLYLPNFGAFGNAQTLVDLAQMAEAAGWDGFFIWDHVAGHPLPMVDPWVALSAVAVATKLIRFGTTVTPLPRRRPWKIARETVSLNHLSNGRLTLGVGIGLGEAEWHDLGEEPEQKRRGAMLDEALMVLTGLWQAEPFSHDGEFYTVRKAHFRPPPIQQPRVPIWGGWSISLPTVSAPVWKRSHGRCRLFRNGYSKDHRPAKKAAVPQKLRRQNCCRHSVGLYGWRISFQ